MRNQSRGMAIVRNDSGKISRRILLNALATAAAGVAVPASSNIASAGKAKKSHAEVEYQETPHGEERCEICAPFLPPDQCRTVVGPVSRQGWCKIYTGA